MKIKGVNGAVGFFQKVEMLFAQYLRDRKDIITIFKYFFGKFKKIGVAVRARNLSVFYKDFTFL